MYYQASSYFGYCTRVAFILIFLYRSIQKADDPMDLSANESPHFLIKKDNHFINHCNLSAMISFKVRCYLREVSHWKGGGSSWVYNNGALVIRAAMVYICICMLNASSLKSCMVYAMRVLFSTSWTFTLMCVFLISFPTTKMMHYYVTWHHSPARHEGDDNITCSLRDFGDAYDHSCHMSRIWDIEFPFIGMLLSIILSSCLLQSSWANHSH